jgi:UDPglucose 6-dehydrogenase
LAVLGFAFKGDTNDTRESPAIRICLDLIEEGAHLAIYDPKVASAQITADLGQAEAGQDQGPPQPGQGEGRWQLAPSAREAASGADAVLILTEWREFQQIDWAGLAVSMRQPAWLFDGRAIADTAAARAAGLNVWTVGEG